MQGYDVDLFILALAKTVTPGGVPRGSGAGRLVFARRLQPLSRADKAPTGFGVPVWRTGSQKPDEANDIYRPVSRSYFIYNSGGKKNCVTSVIGIIDKISVSFLIAWKRSI
jgi:hypothetical protein